MKNLVSIIVAAYNVENYLTECIESILNQSYKKIEILIIDDGSKDNTSAIAKKYENLYNNIRYIRQSNSGVSIVRNNGIESAVGEFICFVDGDDSLPIDAIECLMTEIQDNHEIDIVCSCCNAFGVGDTFIDEFFTETFQAFSFDQKKPFYMQLMNGNYGKKNKSSVTAIGVPWGKLYRLSLLKENNIYFNPKLIRMQDNIFNMNAFYSAKGIKYINIPCYNYRVNHVKSFGFKCPASVWVDLLTERDEFSKKCKEMEVWDNDLENALIYEKGIGLFSSIGYYTSYKERNQAIKLIKGLQKEECYSCLFQKNSKCVVSKKFVFIIMLMKLNLYSILFGLIKVYIKFCI